MSIDTSSMLLVGLPHDELFFGLEWDELSGIEKADKREEYDRASPYYDAENEHCIFGVAIAESGRYTAKQIDIGGGQVHAAATEFLKRSGGKSGLVYLSPNVT